MGTPASDSLPMDPTARSERAGKDSLIILYTYRTMEVESSLHFLPCPGWALHEPVVRRTLTSAIMSHVLATLRAMVGKETLPGRH